MKTLTFLAIAAAITMSSCAKDRIEANGHIITETRELRSFSGLNLSGSKRISVVYGSQFKVELKGSSNLISRYKSEVTGGILNVGYENRVNVVDDDISVQVTLPEIEEVNLSGSGKINITGFPDEDRLKVRISGSGKVTVEDSFNIDKVEVDISGSGDADLDEVKATEADIDISGSGSVRLGVENYLKARISGSGKVYYWGNAEVDSRISGSGKVIKN